MLGSTTPRLWTKPLVRGRPGPCGCGCALTPATSKGFSVVDFAHDVLGLRLLPWQRWLLIHALELLPDGRYRFRTVVVLVSRQNGKTSVVEVKNVWKMYVQGAQVLGTAQDLDVSEESWDNAVEMCEGIPELAVEIKDVIKVNGKKALRLTNGARWKVKAATRRGGRGFSGDDINLDELREHQTWNAWGAITKTTRARPNAQVWAITNAGDDKSVVLNELQGSGRAAVEDPAADEVSIGLFEWSAPDDTRCTCGRVKPQRHSRSCRMADPALWAMSNPALGYLITPETMWSDLQTDPDEVYLAECLCVRVKDLTPSVIDLVKWADAHDPDSAATGQVAFSLDVDPDRKWSAIGMTGRRRDGLKHWQILRHAQGLDRLLEAAIELNGQHSNCGWFIDPSSPANSLVAPMEKAGLVVHKVAGQDLTAACTAIQTAAEDGTGRHLGQEPLDEAWKVARVANVGDSERFVRRKSTGDITPLMVVTLSDHGFRVHGESDSSPWALYA